LFEGLPRLMRLPLIIQFRRDLCRRRQHTLFDRHPGYILLTAFAGPLLAIAGFGVYRGVQQYTAKGSPVIPLLLSGIAVWIGFGLGRQLRLNRDRQWNSFIQTMPIRPIDLLVLRIYTGIPVGLIGIVLFICGLRGAGVDLWTVSASFKWSLIMIAFAWAIFIPLFIGILASRFAWGSIPAHPKDLFITAPMRKLISRIFPNACGGQMAIELLRMIRGPRTRLLFYAIVSVTAGLGLQIAHPESSHYLLMPVAFALFAVNERADLLQIRQADFLYYLYGVETRDYLRGLIVSVGCLVSLLSLVQIPILGDSDTRTMCVCIAIAFSSMGMNVAFDHYSRHTTFFKYLIAFLLFAGIISEAWGMIPLVILLCFNVLRVPCLIYCLILLSLSFGVNGLIPLLIAAMFVASEIYRTRPDIVKKWYWKLSE